MYKTKVVEAYKVSPEDGALMAATYAEYSPEEKEEGGGRVTWVNPEEDPYTRRMDLGGYPIVYSGEVYSYWQTEVQEEVQNTNIRNKESKHALKKKN